MKSFLFGLLSFCLIDSLNAQAILPQYVSGVEGIQSAYLPPPGVYFRDYTYNFWSDHINGNHGNRLNIPFSETVVANAPRVTWVSPYSPGGFTFGLGGYLPIVSSSISIFGQRQSRLGISDLFLEPLIISKKLPNWDFIFSAGVFAPTGHFDPANLASPGKGFWTGMLTTGATWSPTPNWNVSLLDRYELPTRQETTHIQPGQTDVLEGAIAYQYIPIPKSYTDPKNLLLSKDSKELVAPERKMPPYLLDFGIDGSYTTQVTPSTSPFASGNLPYGEDFAVGPEILLNLPAQHTLLSLRWEHDLITHNLPQGNEITFTFTRRF